MKSLPFTLLFLFSTFTMFSQRTIEKEVESFKEVKVFDLIEVNLIKSVTNKVVIKGDNVDDVKLKMDEGALLIRLELEERLDGNHTYVDVYYTNLEVLDVNEGSKITSEETITESNMTLRAQEGATINVPLAVENLDIKSVSGGMIYTKGKATAQDININSGGKYFASELITETTELNVTAGGTAEINATTYANVKVTAGGTIKVYGNPKKLKKRRFAGGKIKVID